MYLDMKDKPQLRKTHFSQADTIALSSGLVLSMALQPVSCSCSPPSPPPAPPPPPPAPPPCSTSMSRTWCGCWCWAKLQNVFKHKPTIPAARSHWAVAVLSLWYSLAKKSQLAVTQDYCQPVWWWLNKSSRMNKVFNTIEGVGGCQADCWCWGGAAETDGGRSADRWLWQVH